MPSKNQRPYTSESMLDPKVEAKINAQLVAQEKERKNLDERQELATYEIKVLIPGIVVKRLQSITLDFGKPNPYDKI